MRAASVTIAYVYFGCAFYAHIITPYTHITRSGRLPNTTAFIIVAIAKGAPGAPRENRAIVGSRE